MSKISLQIETTSLQYLLQLALENWLDQSAVKPSTLGLQLEVFLLVCCHTAKVGLLNFLKGSVLVLLDHLLDLLNALKAVHLGHTIVEQDQRVEAKIASIEAILHQLYRIFLTLSAACTQLELLERHAHRIQVQLIVINDQHLTCLIGIELSCFLILIAHREQA